MTQKKTETNINFLFFFKKIKELEYFNDKINRFIEDKKGIIQLIIFISTILTLFVVLIK